MRDLDEYKREWTDSFQFEFVEVADLTANEWVVWDRLPQIFDARGGRPGRVRDVLISKTMRPEAHGYREAVGLWQADTSTIVFKRDRLRSLQAFAGTVIHEVAHAASGAPDISAKFEDALTNELGTIASE